MKIEIHDHLKICLSQQTNLPPFSHKLCSPTSPNHFPIIYIPQLLSQYPMKLANTFSSSLSRLPLSTTTTQPHFIPHISPKPSTASSLVTDETSRYILLSSSDAPLSYYSTLLPSHSFAFIPRISPIPHPFLCSHQNQTLIHLIRYDKIYQYNM